MRGESREGSRPPGGKTLIRLLQLLESAGYTGAANVAVQTAVREQEREEFREVTEQFSLIPSDEAPDRALVERESVVAEDIAQTYLDVGEQLGPPTPTGPQWRSVGPWTIWNGQTYGASRVNVSGRVSAVAVHPQDPARVLAGAANGGVWESRDRGASWTPRTDYAATLAVGALAFNPANPAIVYCGTGEGNWWSFLGAGILRSADGGTTWATLCTNPFVGQGFYDLVVDPTDARRLFAGTTGGLYVSNDRGVTWRRRRTQRTWSLSVAPNGNIFAASSDGVRRSTDHGVTWPAVTLPGAPTAFTRLAVEIAPSNPAVVYAWGASGGTAYLWRRAGGTWTAVAPPPGVATGQAWYDWFLAVAPDRDTQVYCGAIETHRGDLSGSTWTWRNLTNKGNIGDSIHPDQHAIAFEPGNPNTIYVGNDGGLYRSPDRGITWQHCNNGLVVSEFEYITHNFGTSRWILGGTQDNGTDRWTGSGSWDHVADADGGDCGVNRNNPRTVFTTWNSWGSQLRPWRSTTGGDFGSWTFIPPPVPDGEGSPFYPPFETSATGGDTIAIGGGAVYVSRNNGTNWTRLTFPAAGTASAMYVPNADNVYVGTEDGRVFRTTWNGANWGALTALTTPRAGAFMSDLYVDPNNTSRMWATHRTIGNGRVWRSDDGGTSWNDRTAGLPALPMNAVQVDPANANRVWVAADLGVYQSTDGGTTWTDFSNGLPNMFVGDLIFHPHARVLRAGTRNRGVWEIPVDGWMTQPQCGVQWNGNLAGNETRRWFTFNWPATWHVVWTVMPTTPRLGSPQVSWSVAVERASAEYVTYWITVNNLTPDPLAFEGRYCILSRY